MRSVAEWLELYGESHRNRTNRAIHFVCVPMITLSLLVLLAELQPAPSLRWLNGGTALLIFSVVYYLNLSVPLALGMFVIGGAMLASVGLLSLLPVPNWQVGVVLFAVGWTAQFYGHKIEGKKPSFLEDVQFLLIGPIWVLSQAYRFFGIRC